MKHLKALAYTTLTLIAVGCMSTEPFYQHDEQTWSERQLPPSDKLLHTVYLIGDAGKPTTDTVDKTMSLLKDFVTNSDQENTSVLFLGDNIYPEGLHKNKHFDSYLDKMRIEAQMNVVRNFDGNIVFIPGNHDWKQGKKEGIDFVNRQEKYVEKYLDEGNVFLPSNGCPGPEVIEINDDLVMIIIDTQWWLHRHKRGEGEKDDCEVKDELEFLTLFKDALKRNRNKQIIVAAHHPLYTNGTHGGNYTLNHHLFPLRAVNKKLVIPMPVLGSIYPYYRKFLGDIQDNAHPHYQTMINEFTAAFSDLDRVIYVAGHEHNLQYTMKDSVHYIVSGAGSKTSFVKHNRQVDFAVMQKGFSRISYYEEGEVWLEFFSSESKSKEPLYRKQLQGPVPPVETFEGTIDPSIFNDSTVKVVPGASYDAGFMKKLFFGGLHRESWAAEIEVRVLNMYEEHDGLTPIQRGGGMQTKSLRMQGGDGHQYVIRSIQKYPASVIPRELRTTVAADIVQDGIAASHPYAAIVIPPLADAVKVYHTNPELVFVPASPKLGQYLDEFSGMLCLYEERPEGDQSHQASFGNTKKVVSSGKMIEKLEADYDHQVDEFAMLRARFFDMLIADWDRHDDQWRWATFKTKKGTTYRPIPRDRDQAFFTQDGFIPYFSNRKWAVRKFQSFKEDIRDIHGQNFNARFVDRAYLTELSLEDWMAVADSMQNEMTDSIIEAAIAGFPDAAYDIKGEEIVTILKARRDKLKEFAERHYMVLAHHVNVVGTEKDEYFEVKRLNDNETQVSVFPRNKKNKPNRKKVLYQRTFKTDETKEIRIYGIDGNDEYHISGEVDKGIMIRIVAGNEKDKIVAESRVKGLRNKTHIYEVKSKKKKEKNKLKLGPEATAKVLKKSAAVGYDREEFKYDKLSPIAFIGFNPDDGIFLGGGVDIINHGFKKSPYRSRHRIKGNYAVATGAYNFDYEFHFPELIRNWDFAGHADIKFPEYTFNFYGLGNNTIRLSDRQNDYRLNLNILEFRPEFRRTFRDIHSVYIGPAFQYVRPDDNFLEISALLEGYELPTSSSERFFAGMHLGYELENVDNVHNPHRGIRFDADVASFDDLDENRSFTRLKSSMSLYFPLNWMPGKATLGVRTGGAVNFGDATFYQANFIGGFHTMRGFRRNRFGGDASFYNNIDLRVKLFDWKNYVVPIEFGLIGFHDYGRVWVDGEDSNTWHRGYGGGIYISPLDAVVITTFYGKSNDDEFLAVRFGFLF